MDYDTGVPLLRASIALMLSDERLLEDTLADACRARDRGTVPLEGLALADDDDVARRVLPSGATGEGVGVAGLRRPTRSSRWSLRTTRLGFDQS